MVSLFNFCPIRLLLALGLCVVAGCVDAQDREAESDAGPLKDIVQAVLSVDPATITPGQAITVSINFKIRAPWHIYWKQPGELGLPTRIRFELPPGFEAAEIQWPKPVTFMQPGNIKGYGYAEQVTLRSVVSTPAHLLGTSGVTLAAKVKWLACSDRCVPGEADLKIEVPVAVALSRTSLDDRATG